ncbi:MAG: tetratricopeptide repeat protein [Patescibacteria group bacterium]
MDSSSSSLNKLAIDAALDSRWTEALKLNKQIIKVDPENTDALNRQARCYMELGRNNLAKKYYSLVLKFDPYNPIAQKNLKIIKAFKPDGNHHAIDGQGKVAPALFLQEPGKTKVVTLLKVAEPKILSKTFCGMQVDMVLKNKKIIVVDPYGYYLGVLPDDICRHLIRLIKGGNKYSLIIKSIKVNGLSVLIRETYRSKRFKNQSSFLDGVQYQSVDVITSLEAESPDEEIIVEDEET